MTKGSICWNIINSFLICFLWFFVLFTIGELPNLEKRTTEIETKVKMIEYHLQCSKLNDTIIINNYLKSK